MNMDPVHLWGEMGFIAKFVAFTLIAMALATLVVTIERLLVFNRATQQSLALAERLGVLLEGSDIPGAVSLAEDQAFKTSYLAPIVSEGLKAYSTRARIRGAKPVEAAKRAIDKSVQLEDMGLRRGVSILATVASTSPFVGLFGTVFGIINAFAAMGQSGTGGIGAVSAGIAEALITTAFGLAVAIPATWSFNYFIGRIETMGTEMAVSTTELVDFCVRQEETSNAA